MSKVVTSPRSLVCAEAFFKCDEVLPGDGSGSIKCSITGAEFNPASQNIDDPGTPANPTYWIVNGATNYNSVNSTGTTVINLNTGSFPDFSQRHVILFACGTVTQAGAIHFPFGNGGTADWGNEGTISFSTAGQLHGLVRGQYETLVTSSANPVGLTMTNAAHGGQFVGLIVEYVPATTDGVTVTNGSYYAKVINRAGVIVKSASDGISDLVQNLVVNTVGDVNPGLSNKTRFSGLNFYSICAFSFENGLPSNRENVYKWMMRHHSVGNRALPPQWVYET